MPVTEFYGETDWEGSSGPIISREYDAADLWPHGLASERAGGNKDILEDGLHPFLAIGPKASRIARMKCGVVITMETNLVQVNVAEGFAAKAYVANVLTYDGAHDPATFDGSLAIGEPVYLDDSDALSAGVTLSRSPLNSFGEANPLAGWLWYDQDDYHNNDVGGANAAADWPKTISDSALVETLVTVILY